MSHPELEFFNGLSGKLEIELTGPTENIGKLDNVRATPEARVAKLTLKAQVFVQEEGSFRELTDQERNSVAFRGSQISLKGETGSPVSHNASNGESFTVEELLAAVAETERQTRDQSEWFGGVDVHHVFFEGIHEEEDGVWEIYWGS